MFLQRFISWVILIWIVLSTGCGTLRNGRGWGEDAFSDSNLTKVGRAAYRAFFSWGTLIPAAGALLVRVDDYDAKIVDWASKHHPLFGSGDAARTGSDFLYVWFHLETLSSSLATPSGEDEKEWAASKGKGLAVEALALGTAGGTTLLLRDAIHRTTPDKSNNYSSPSGHSYSAFGNVALTNRNLDYIPMSEKARFALKAGNIFLASAMSWARMEERRHFPSDLLFGAALGNFFCTFFYEAFMNLPEGFGVSFIPMRGGGGGQLSFTFH